MPVMFSMSEMARAELLRPVFKIGISNYTEDRPALPAITAPATDGCRA